MDLKQIKEKDLKQFGVVLGIILVVIAGLQMLRGHHPALPKYFISIAVIAEICACIKPGLLKPIFIIFTKVGKVIGWVNTRVLLMLVFYLIMTPIGMILRLCGKDLLQQKMGKDEGSYWQERTTQYFAPEHYEKQF